MPNEHKNKVVYDGQTLIDLSNDTLDSSDKLLAGVTAHDRSGAQITGSMTIPVTSVNTQTGDVVLDYSDVGAAASSHTHSASDITSGLATVATSGSYDDLSDTPTIPENMVVLSYGSSTWQDFIDAYTDNRVVYCRASSGSNPASGAQTRMAFMAYINANPPTTEVEFQYYRSVSSHSATQQGDQVFVYKLNKTNGWSVTTREAMSKIAVGTGLSSSYANGTITLSAKPSSTTPVVDGTAAVGTSDTYARADHVHPTDTSRAAASHTHSASDITSGLATVATSGSYSDLTDTPAIPANTSDLTNDSGFITASDIPVTSVNSKTGAVSLTYSDVGAAASSHGTHVTYDTTNNPNMDGTASKGTATTVSRSDHVHPSDTSRVPTSRTVNGKALSSNISLTYSDVGAAASSHGTHVTYPDPFTNPVMNGSPSPGTATTVARSDHRHPSDTAKVTCASLTNTSVNDISEPGLYYCATTVTGLPSRNAYTQWVLEVIASMSRSYVKQIARAYGSESTVYERHGTTGSWEPWVETSPIIRVVQDLSTMQYYRKPGSTNYGTFLVMGTIAGIGGIALLIVIQNADIQATINLRTGSAYSNSNVTFYYGVNSTNDYGYLGIKTTSTTASSFTIIGS